MLLSLCVGVVNAACYAGSVAGSIVLLSVCPSVRPCVHAETLLTLTKLTALMHFGTELMASDFVIRR